MGRVRTTLEIEQTLTTPDGSANHYVPLVQAIEFPYRDLPVDPYLLGALLGDGCFRQKMVLFSTRDEEMVAAVRATIPATCDLRPAGLDWGIRRRGHSGRNAMREKIEALGLGELLSGDKFVPDEYLFAAPGQRLALLQGLCDTDGTVDHRDMVLLEEEKTSRVMVCVSRSQNGGCLVLDL